MADNISVTEGTGKTVATDDVSGVQYQVVKLDIGGNGVSIPVTDLSTSAKQDTGNTSLSSIDTKTPALGQALAAASTPIVLTASQLTTLTPPAAITNYANETGGNLATLAGAITSSVLQANVKQINGVTTLMGNGVTGTGSQRVTIASDNTAFSVNATLSAETTKVIGVTRTADGSGNLLTSTGNALDINIKTGNLTTLPVTNAGTFAVQATIAAGATNIAKAEDVASADADVGVPAMAIRKASPANTSGTDGDYEMLQVSAGRLWVSSTVDTALPAGTNVIGHVISDSGSVTNATLSAETTKVIGVTRTSDGAGNLLTSNSTTYTAKFGLDANILGTLGTAFSTAGKVDVKGADGDLFVRQATGSNLHTVLDSGTLTTLTGITNTVVTDDLAAAPTGSAVPANAQYQGNIAKTSLPSAASDGNLTGNMSDKYGRSVMLNNAIRDIMGTQTTTITASTSETTIITAIASTFNDLVSVFISNTSATAARVDIRDTTAGSVIFQLYIPAGDMRGLSLTTPWPQTSVNTNWTAQSSASVTDLRVSALYIKNK